MKHLQFRIYLVSAFFISALSFPFLNDRFHFINDIASFENRRLAQKPAMDIQSLDPYPAAFESYYNDTFALRSRIILNYNRYCILLLKKTPFPDEIIIGKGNWLFLGNNHMDAHLGKDSFTEKEMFTLKEEFERRKNYLASKHCKFYVLITPSKANIYPENIPRRFIKIKEQGWGEQLIEYMHKHSDVELVDLFKPFRELKHGDPLYYYTDLHWNRLGAFRASNAVIKTMASKIPGINPMPLSNYMLTKSPGGVGDIMRMVGDLDLYKDTEYELTPRAGYKAKDAKKQYPVPAGYYFPDDYECRKEIKNSDAPKLLIFSDSFGKSFFPFIAEHFSTTVKIFDGWDYIMHKNMVEKEQPDVVLLMVYEPFIRNILKHLNE